MKVLTENLEGAALDWAVGKAMGCDLVIGSGLIYEVFDRDNYNTDDLHNCAPFSPSSNWEHGGPLIQAFKLVVSPDPRDGWRARDYMNSRYWIGETPLVAICRAAVGLSLGDEIEVPDELMEVPA